MGTPEDIAAELYFTPTLSDDEWCARIKDNRYFRPCDEISCNKCEGLTELIAKAQQALITALKDAEKEEAVKAERERIYRGVITVMAKKKDYIEIRMKLDVWQSLKQ